MADGQCWITADVNGECQEAQGAGVPSKDWINRQMARHGTKAKPYTLKSAGVVAATGTNSPVIPERQCRI